jgi:hypothetical protein
MMKRIWSKIAVGAALVGTMLTFIATPQPAEARRCPLVLYKACVLTPTGARMSVATNACLARAHHWTILHAGNCQGPNCSFVWAPVCARPAWAPTPMTFPNLCVAEVSDAVFIHNGPCK